MPQNVGDAVLTFIGDTTQLDQAFANVAQGAEASMGAAAASVDGVGKSLQEVDFELDYTASNAAYAGGEIKEAMVQAKVAVDEVKYSTQEAKATMALLGEEAGIRIPRHLRSFVAELPGVGQALSAAFSATAVLILIQLLVEGTEKLANWVGSTFIFTQAMKDSDAAVKEQNTTLLKYQAAIKASEKAISDFGKTPLELASENVTKLSATLATQTETFNENLQMQAAYRMGLDGVTADMAKKAGEANIEISAAMKLTSDLIIQGQLAQADLTIQTQLSTQRAAIDIEESIARSKLKIWAATALYKASTEKQSGNATLLVEKEINDKEYQQTLDKLKRQRAAEQEAAKQYASISDHTNQQKMEQEAKATNAKILAENADHYEKEVKLYQDFQIKFKDITTSIMALKARGLGGPLFGIEIQEFQQLADAAARLGVHLSTDLGKGATTAKTDLALLAKELAQGRISMRDYQQAEMAAMQAQIAYDKEMGKAPALVAQEQKALDALKGSFDKVYTSETKEKTFWDGFSTEFAKKSKSVGDEAQVMGQTMANAASQMDTAFASAIMGALKSGESIGAALEKATAQVLINLATQAGAHALYCTAMGIAELALGVTDSSAAEWFAAAAEFGLVAGAAGAVGLAMSGGAGGSKSSGNSISSSSNPGGGQQTSSSGGGTTQTNVQPKLAAGGIVSKPTTITAGDSPSGGEADEAIMPLEDPDAMAKIGRAIAAQADNFGGLLSQTTLRGAAGSQAPAAAAAAASAPAMGSSGGSTDGDDGGGGDTHNHFHIAGMISADNLHQVIRKINKSVANRQTTLNASNSLRVTRRSQ